MASGRGGGLIIGVSAHILCLFVAGRVHAAEELPPQNDCAEDTKHNTPPSHAVLTSGQASKCSDLS